MTIVNGHEIPTCDELVGMLKQYGDKPIFSGRGWYAVSGFMPCTGGIQLTTVKCPPPGVEPKSDRIATTFKPEVR